jgi:hypothetical protein
MAQMSPSARDLADELIDPKDIWGRNSRFEREPSSLPYEEISRDAGGL